MWLYVLWDLTTIATNYDFMSDAYGTMLNSSKVSMANGFFDDHSLLRASLCPETQAIGSFVARMRCTTTSTLVWMPVSFLITLHNPNTPRFAPSFHLGFASFRTSISKPEANLCFTNNACFSHIITSPCLLCSQLSGPSGPPSQLRCSSTLGPALLANEYQLTSVHRNLSETCLFLELSSRLSIHHQRLQPASGVAAISVVAILALINATKNHSHMGYIKCFENDLGPHTNH